MKLFKTLYFLAGFNVVFGDNVEHAGIVWHDEAYGVVSTDTSHGNHSPTAVTKTAFVTTSCTTTITVTVECETSSSLMGVLEGDKPTEGPLTPSITANGTKTTTITLTSTLEYSIDDTTVAMTPTDATGTKPATTLVSTEPNISGIRSEPPLETAAATGLSLPGVSAAIFAAVGVLPLVI